MTTTALRRALVRSCRPSPAGLLLGAAIDLAVGDPRRLHPVAGAGTVAAIVESRLYADSRLAGVGYSAVCVAAAGAVGAVVGVAGRSAQTRIALTAAATWAVLGGTTLVRVGERVADDLASGDLRAARELIPSLCSRDPDVLDAAGVCRAAVESIAENTSDAAVAPLFWGAVAGIPGLLVYRMANTLDAMVGYRNQRYQRFGWASARLDDVLNLAPARVTGALVVILGADRRGAVRAWRHDATAHPSPNAGVVEAAFAGALDTRLGGRTVYRHREEDRPTLGDGHRPTPEDLREAVRLSRAVQAAMVGIAVSAATVVRMTAAGSGIVGAPFRRRNGR